MTWVVQRQTEDDNTIFEVFVYKSDLREAYGDRYVPASAVADTLDSNSEFIRCSGYEEVEVSRVYTAYSQKAYIFTCTCDEPCSASIIKTYAEGWIEILKTKLNLSQTCEAIGIPQQEKIANKS